MNIDLHCDADISPGQLNYFSELLRGLTAEIDPGDSLKQVLIVDDDEYEPTIQHFQSLMGKTYAPGPNMSYQATFPLEQEDTFSTVIVLRKGFFTPSDNGPIQQSFGLICALYYCRLYHLTWYRRGYLYKRSADLYENDLFTMGGMIHDEYAVLRLSNTLLSQHFDLRIDATGQMVPFFTQYNKSLTDLFHQFPDQLRARGILRLAPSARKDAMLPTVYHFIFQPLATHAGLHAPIPPEYPLLETRTDLSTDIFYQEVIAPYWIPIKRALEGSFTSQFANTEQELPTIMQTADAFLGKLLGLYCKL